MGNFSVYLEVSFIGKSDRYDIEHNEWEVVNPKIGPSILPNLPIQNM